MSLFRWNRPSRFPSVNSMLNDFFSESDGFFDQLSNRNPVPAMNVSESDSQFELELAAPGKSKEEFKIQLKNNQICNSYQNEEESSAKENTTLEKNIVTTRLADLLYYQEVRLKKK